MRILSVLVVLLLAACGGSEFSAGDGAGYEFGWTGNPESGVNPQRPSCPGQESEITGKVLAPNATDPVPGASVFIPAQVPELFPPDVTCEVCGTFGGSTNLWYTTSATDGAFKLTSVCPGKRPLVLQNGRFRRLIYVDVPEKGSVALTAEQTRLPKRAKEFELADAVPKIAVATGDYDKMECVLRKIGLQDGAFDLYEDATVLTSPTKLPTFQSLVSDLARMKTYNIIFINCTANTFEAELKKPEVRQNITTYMQSGGRFYVTDWSYDWIEQVEAFSPFIDFEPGASAGSPEAQNAGALGADGLKIRASIKDDALASWLKLFPNAIDASKTSPIEYFLIDWVIISSIAKDVKLWVEGPIKSRDGSIQGVRPLTLTFNFKNCGKILYSSYHTEGREDEILPLAYPAYCSGASASPQDRILEYLIFDIANCVKPIE